jgi:hypothetical protein
VRVKNFGIWLRYDSRSGTHNMYVLSKFTHASLPTLTYYKLAGTRSSVNSRVPMQCMRSTKTWLPVTVLVSGRSRSCVCKKSPKPRISAARISNSSPRPSCASLSRTGCSRPAPSLSRTVLRLFKLRCDVGWVCCILREHVYVVKKPCILCDYASPKFVLSKVAESARGGRVWTMIAWVDRQNQVFIPGVYDGWTCRAVRSVYIRIGGDQRWVE